MGERVGVSALGTWSDTDLNYRPGGAGTAVPTAANPVIRGGEEQNVTAGLNW